ncbi:SDR family NAD(P)-dependent oxidoreductase [Aestuariibius sp. 2305UL40-4]|uniref:SDR family NAD(P)-dependent oxidoreductase n=1 Tax=Aestuariibius violaceus TaxID=3234132 RepID=UPI00345F113E
MTRPVALVTGGARGIGRAIAEEMAADHYIALTYLGGGPEAAAFAADHPSTLLIQADLTEMPAQVLIDQVADHFGRLDLLVNNAGHVQENPWDSFDAAIASHAMLLNAVVPMALIAAAAPKMPRGASIVNIASTNARFPPNAAPDYGASKAALLNITTSAAKMFAPMGLRVNAVSPGAVERAYKPRPAEMVAEIEAATPLGAMATVTDVARAVRFLASPAAASITGEEITVAGGYGLF